MLAGGLARPASTQGANCLVHGARLAGLIVDKGFDVRKPYYADPIAETDEQAGANNSNFSVCAAFRWLIRAVMSSMRQADVRFPSLTGEG